MAKMYGEAELVESYAKKLIGPFHPELATARIKYIFVDKGSIKSGRPVFGKVRKISGALEYLTQLDFLVEIALDHWNELTEQQRTALVDHLLERCWGEESEEDSGAFKWSIREPDVQEFGSILQRHGVWNDSLGGFVSIAKKIKVDDLVDDVVSSAARDVTQSN